MTLSSICDIKDESVKFENKMRLKMNSSLLVCIVSTLILASPPATGLGVEVGAAVIERICSQHSEFQVEDVTGKQLEAALQTEELLAVMFCKYQGRGSDCSFKISNSWV